MTTLQALRRGLVHGIRLVLLGALTLAPLLVTIWLASLLFQAIATVGRLFLGPLTGVGLRGMDGPLVQVLAALAVLALVGALAHSRVGRAVSAAADRLVDQIPGIKSVYRGVQRILASFGAGSGDDKRKVVLIEFPSPHMKAIGLVTRRFKAADSGRELAAVYVPTTPNPSSGYIEIVPVERLVWLDWSAQAAIEFIMSGGVIGPDDITFEAASTRPPPL